MDTPCIESPFATVEVEQESDGRWIAEVIDLPGAMAYGASEAEAVRLAEELARRVLAQLEAT
jgi:predicted RNase H-like HicB family nuclease